MAPSWNSTLLTKPPTRARTCTSSIASKRPVNSSQSVTVRLVGCATVTAWGGGAACCCGWLPHADNVKANRTASEAGASERTEDGPGCLARAKRPHCSAALKSISLRSLPATKRCRLDENGPDSLQDGGRIKENRYALRQARSIQFCDRAIR